MAEDKPKSFVAACRSFFGHKPDQKLQEFLAEVKLLTEEDRKEMAPQLAVALGCEVSP